MEAQKGYTVDSKLEHLTPEQEHPYPAFCSPPLLNYGAKVGDILIEKVLKQFI